MVTCKPATYYCRPRAGGLMTCGCPAPRADLDPESLKYLVPSGEGGPQTPPQCVLAEQPDPDFEAKAHDICSLSLNALYFLDPRRVVICRDEKTGMRILQRKFPTQPIAPGRLAKREHDYIRHGTWVLLASFVVPTGQVVWKLGQTRAHADFATHLANVMEQLPVMTR